MPYPLPPNKAGAYTATRLQNHDHRIGVEERRVLPEPRTYYSEQVANTVLTTGAKTNFGAAIPIFWRPGNTISIMAQFNQVSTAGATTINLLVGDSPVMGAGIDTPIIGGVPVPLVAETRATSIASTQGIALNPFYPYFATPLYQTPTAGYTSSTSAGTFNIQMKVQRTAGAGTVTVNTLKVWITVY